MFEAKFVTNIFAVVAFFSRYCSKLPGDRFTHPEPVFEVEEIGKNGYRCKLEMPTNCPLRRAIIVSTATSAVFCQGLMYKHGEYL